MTRITTSKVEMTVDYTQQNGQHVCQEKLY